jgi:hypothetical protein
MTYNYAVLTAHGLLWTRTLTRTKAERVAREINGSVKAQVYIGGVK